MRRFGKSLITALIIFSLFSGGVYAVDHWVVTQGQYALQNQLKQATVHCYATEGRYPPDLAYIRLHYGVRTDHRRYIVDYRRTAPDRAPEIKVSRKQEGAWA